MFYLFQVKYIFKLEATKFIRQQYISKSIFTQRHVALCFILNRSLCFSFPLPYVEINDYLHKEKMKVSYLNAFKVD